MSSRERLERLLATARTNPEFASRMLSRLPEAAQSAVVQALAIEPPAPKPANLRKCKPKQEGLPAYGDHSGYSAQLNLFARSTSRVA